MKAYLETSRKTGDEYAGDSLGAPLVLLLTVLPMLLDFIDRRTSDEASTAQLVTA